MEWKCKIILIWFVRMEYHCQHISVLFLDIFFLKHLLIIINLASIFCKSSNNLITINLRCICIIAKPYWSNQHNLMILHPVMICSWEEEVIIKFSSLQYYLLKIKLNLVMFSMLMLLKDFPWNSVMMGQVKSSLLNRVVLEMWIIQFLLVSFCQTISLKNFKAPILRATMLILLERKLGNQISILLKIKWMWVCQSKKFSLKYYQPRR